MGSGLEMSSRSGSDEELFWGTFIGRDELRRFEREDLAAPEGQLHAGWILVRQAYEHPDASIVLGVFKC